METSTTNKRTVEVFVAGCPACSEAVQLVRELACESCDVRVRDMNEATHYERAQDLGVNRVPAVAVEGELAACCQTSPITEDALRSAGIGQPR